MNKMKAVINRIKSIFEVTKTTGTEVNTDANSQRGLSKLFSALLHGSALSMLLSSVAFADVTEADILASFAPLKNFLLILQVGVGVLGGVIAFLGIIKFIMWFAEGRTEGFPRDAIGKLIVGMALGVVALKAPALLLPQLYA